MSRTCLILGAGGFIGTAVARQLLMEGWRVRGFDRASTPPGGLANVEGLTWISGDFQVGEDIDRALAGVDAVVHLICTSLPKSSNEGPVRDVEGNVLATLGLLGAMVKRGVTKIVFASSGGTIYGIARTLPIQEDHSTRPEVSYGITKLAIEKYLYLFARMHSLRPVSLRISNPYGHGQRVDQAQGAVAAFLHRAVHGEAIEIWGDGSVTRDYVHVDDVASAFARALRYDGSHQVFNIGSGRGVTLNELVRAIERQIGRPLMCRYLPGRHFDVPASVLDNTLAREELGWQPTITLADGLRRTLASMIR